MEKSNKYSSTKISVSEQPWK